MPNFWTKTTQKIDEAFKGPRTIDIEFDSLIKEMNDVEKGMIIFKQLLINIKSISTSYKLYFSNIAEALLNIYSKYSPFYNLIENILEIHKQLEIRCDLYTQSIMRLLPKTTEWSNFFHQVKHPLENREKARKVYDHYDAKMESLYRHNNKKNKKGNYVERNQDKLCQSALKYAEMSEEAYHVLSDIMNRRYEMINPVLLELLIEEREFLKNEGEISMKLNDIEEQFSLVQKSVMLYVRKDYNPGKYVRGGLLLLKTNNNSNDKKKFITEDLNNTNIFGKKENEDKFEFELTPIIKKNGTFRRRNIGLVADIEKLKHFSNIPDVFSNVITKFTNQSIKDSAYKKLAFTEIYTKQNVNNTQRTYKNDDIFNDFF